MNASSDRAGAPVVSNGPRWAAILLWIVQGLLALAFLTAGSAKLIGAEQMVTVFTDIGIGQWFRFVTGALEVIGAILALIPRTAPLGAALLACIMVGAVITHLFVIGGSAVPAIALLALALVVLWFRRHSLRAN